MKTFQDQKRLSSKTYHQLKRDRFASLTEKAYIEKFIALSFAKQLNFESLSPL